MDASPALGHRFHPELPLLLGALALFVAVLTGFALGVLATAGQREAASVSPYLALPAASSGPAADAICTSGTPPGLRREATSMPQG